jgi:hypothetical protein
VPRLSGLTLAKARRRAARSGCRIHVAGAPILTLPGERVITGVDPGRRIARQERNPDGQWIDVWLVPQCVEPGDPGPPAGEPFLTPGPTELISGLYLGGGPIASYPGPCRSGTPGAGMIVVIDPASGATVATATVANGQLATIPLPPGTYTVEGTFYDARTVTSPTDPGVPWQSSISVTIPAGMTVRQDLSVGVP